MDLAERLIHFLPGDFEKMVWFGVSGSDAMDFLAKVVPISSGRPRLISFTGAFHGMTGCHGTSHPRGLHMQMPCLLSQEDPQYFFALISAHYGA